MYKEPESAWAKVFTPALQGQVTAGRSGLGAETSLAQPEPRRGKWSFLPKAAAEEEFRINCQLTLQDILFLVANITVIVSVWFWGYIKKLPGVIEAGAKALSAGGQFAAPLPDDVPSLSLGFPLFCT